MKRLLLLVLIFTLNTVASFAQSSIDSKQEHFIIDSYIGEEKEYQTPYYIFRTEKEYPKILIDAGIHGDEVAGIYACDTVMKYINVLEGTIGFIPRVNIKSYEQNVRGVNIDLNQVFPGDIKGSIYEEQLAYDFMTFVDEFRPDYVINLHEAWTKFDERLYNRQKDKSFGQTFITNSESFSDFLIRSHLNVNKQIHDSEYKFRIQYFPYKANHSMDNIIEKLKIPSYTVETLRILPLEERIEYQIICILTFIEEAGIKFTYDR
ncbi:MAG: succinylglutamate desuccinylase/aspartoacylase family protein [Candidatus Kapaibacterium sp.]